ncbi:host nuclease inhibitor protein [Pseudomonas balearica]|uniref:host nuclease inhibitor protein n=1 Tax=Stutzerimonas balearica TaxID=74829 RepID=UPI001F48B010|nr:host nuclease inhibitor protein [Stutzerimonas balearica]MCF6758286.1 host nuclease inhibitor protein [Stutzerimonas balearica]
MSNGNEIENAVEQLMDQAQVFASAWALVGGQFDQGGQLEVATDEKEYLKELIEDFRDLVKAESREPGMLEISQGLIKWHQGRLALFSKVLGTPADAEIRLGEDDPIVLDGEKAKGFRMGLLVARQWIEKFPLSISSDEPDCEEE